MRWILTPKQQRASEAGEGRGANGREECFDPTLPSFFYKPNQTICLSLSTPPRPHHPARGRANLPLALLTSSSPHFLLLCTAAASKRSNGDGGSEYRARYSSSRCSRQSLVHHGDVVVAIRWVFVAICGRGVVIIKFIIARRDETWG